MVDSNWNALRPPSVKKLIVNLHEIGQDTTTTHNKIRQSLERSVTNSKKKPINFVKNDPNRNKHRENEYAANVHKENINSGNTHNEDTLLPSISSEDNLLALFPRLGSNTKNPGKYIAIDCEMVGVGSNGIRSVLARVSIVNYHGHVLLDLFVKPQEKITDFREAITGIKPWHLFKTGIPFTEAISKVHELINNRIIIGHDLEHDFQVLMLNVSRKSIRDTAIWKPLRKIVNCHGKPSLKRLTEHILGAKIQTGSHDSTEDARAAMLIYRKHKKEWDSSLTTR